MSFTHIVPKADRFTLMQQPDSPVKSIASTDFPQVDSAIVEFAIILTIVDTLGSTVIVISLTGCRRRRRRFGEARELRKAGELGESWKTRKSTELRSRSGVGSSGQSSDGKRLRGVHIC